MPIYIPTDRTDEVRAMGCCYNPRCREKNADRYEFELPADASTVKCPKCGANEPPLVHLLVCIHLLVLDPNGRIIGQGGLTYRVACNENRVHLATRENMEAATNQLEACNCPECKEAIKGLPRVPGGGFELSIGDRSVEKKKKG